MDIIIKKQELEDISSLLPTIIYNELLKFTEEPISIEGDVTIPTTESVVETKIDKSVLLIKIKLFKKALEKDKGNKVLKIKIKLFEKELTKYAYGGGVGDKFKEGDFVFANMNTKDTSSKIPFVVLHKKGSTSKNVPNEYYVIGDGSHYLKEERLSKATEKDFDDYYTKEGLTQKQIQSFKNQFNYAKGGGVDKVYKLIDGENTWYLTYLDSTHFFLSNTKEYKGSPYHIGEFRSRPFYNEVLSWLNSNKGKMAKGGGVDYNENREMVLNDNKQIAHHTKELQNAVKGKKVPAWVVAKVNRSTTDLSDSTHYMEWQGKSYSDGGSIKIGDKVMLPEIKMRDGKIQFEKVENGEVIEIENGIYSVLNPKTNRIHQVSINQIKFNNGGSLDEFLDKKRMELNSYSDERIAKFYSALKDIDYTDTLIELEGNAGERRNMIQELMDELTIRHNTRNKNKFEGGGVFNGKYLDNISADKKNKILKNIANNYGFSIAEALAEVVDADAELLYEYISNDQSLRMSVYNDIEGGKFAKGTTIKGLFSKAKEFGSKGYGKAKELTKKGVDATKKAIHDKKKEIALDVLYETKENLAEGRDEKKATEKAFRVVDERFAKGGGTSKIWIVNIAMPTSNNNMPKLIKKEIELGRMSNEFDVKQAILRKGGDWLGNGKVLSVYEKK